ncbi:MAG TPA: NAD(P)H-binding protein, partial [Nitrospiraceae bacterium]|nr:NAD(P)H-binding protein [Nitrospiraceae bacterium]
MHVLIVGASGLIGKALAARLAAGGDAVTGTTRSGPDLSLPSVGWIDLDLRDAISQNTWTPHLQKVDAVVNCAGVLQDGPRDATSAVHAGAPTALYRACERAGVRRVIQLSAIGVERETPTAFSQTKLDGDRALMASELEWVILRPSVVTG